MKLSMEVTACASHAIHQAEMPFFRTHPNETVQALLVNATAILLAFHAPELDAGEGGRAVNRIARETHEAMIARVESIDVERGMRLWEPE